MCFVDRKPSHRLRLILLFFMASVVMIVSTGELDIAFLYLKDRPIELSYSRYTIWLASRQGLSSVMLMFGLPSLKRWGLGDRAVCAMGLVSKMAAFILMAVSFNANMVFIGKYLVNILFFNPADPQGIT